MNKLVYSNNRLYFLIVIIIFLSILFLWFIESFNNKQAILEQRSHIQEQLNIIRNRLENNTFSNIHLLKGLPSVINLNPNLTKKQFEQIAQPLMDGYGTLRNIGLAPNMIIKMIYPLKGNEKAIGLNYRLQQLEYPLIELARKKRVLILSGPVELVQGGIGIIGRFPVFIKAPQGQEVFWGIISAVIDIKSLYRNSGLLDEHLDFHIALRGKDAKGASGDVFFGDKAIFDNDPIILDIPLPHGYWQIVAVPKKGWKTQANNLWLLRLAFLLLIFLILALFSIFFHNKKIMRKNQEKYQRLVEDGSSEQSMQHEIKLALEQDELRIFYQPKVNMNTGEVIGVEALIRWQHPDKGLLAPSVFIPCIEHNILMVDVGNWVLRQALTQMQSWQMQGISLKVSVNVDAMQLQQDDFIDALKVLLDDFNELVVSNLELEILENSAVHDIDCVSHIIKECTEMGIQFSLDDFGTGYSSLTYLKRLSAQTLKIDQSFISNLLENSNDMAIVEGILGLSQAFHCQVIAEGVETVEVGTLLLNLGCQFAQGYIISRPMPAEELPQWISNFCVPKEWQEADNTLSSEASYTITLLYLSHHQLSTRVQQAIKQGAGSLIPVHFCDSTLCQLGQWIKGDGKKNYSQFPEFDLLVDKHEQFHDLIIDIIEQLNHQHKVFQSSSIKLNQLSSRVLDYLNRLRNISLNALII